MWMRWCALAMVAGLLCVVAGLGLAVNAQWTLLGCEGDGACASVPLQRRLAIGVSLLGVILSSLSTAAVAGILMRTARPPHPLARPAGAGRMGGDAPVRVDAALLFSQRR